MLNRLVIRPLGGEPQHAAEVAGRVAQGNDDLSRRTQEQASALEETAASMEEMTSSVKQTADNAAQANQLAINTRQLADNGGAVVASEVRTLAQRSASAAKETKDLINDSVAKVGAGCELVDRTGKVLGQIVDSVKKLTDVVHEISAASTEQASGIEQVGNAIAQLDRSTQENAALVEESAAAAETLNRQSADMVQAAAVFKLADDGRARSHVSNHDSGAPVSQSWHEHPTEHSSRIAA